MLDLTVNTLSVKLFLTYMSSNLSVLCASYGTVLFWSCTSE